MMCILRTSVLPRSAPGGAFRNGQNAAVVVPMWDWTGPARSLSQAWRRRPKGLQLSDEALDACSPAPAQAWRRRPPTGAGRRRVSPGRRARRVSRHEVSAGDGGGCGGAAHYAVRNPGRLDRHIPAGLAISAMTRVELHVGRGLLAAGPDHNALFDWMEQLEARFENATLPFDDTSAAFCARLMTRALACGQTALLSEAMLAGMAEAHGLVVAARPTPLLTLWGGPVVDPWR